jgi:hypothetical protein
MIKKMMGAVSTAVKGDHLRDYGAVYEWAEKKESLHVLEYVKAGEHRLEFAMVPDQLTNWRNLAPGFVLAGEREDMVARLGQTLRLIATGKRLAESAKARGKSITMGLFNSGVSDERLVYLQEEHTEAIRVYWAQKNREPILLIIVDSWEDPDDSLWMKILDMIIADRSSNQRSMQWPVGALTAAVQALRSMDLEAGE